MAERGEVEQLEIELNNKTQTSENEDWGAHTSENPNFGKPTFRKSKLKKNPLSKEEPDYKREGASPPTPTPPEIPNFDAMVISEALSVPELAIFKKVTSHTPGMKQWKVLYKVMRSVLEKHNLKADQEAIRYLNPFWEEWVTRGYRKVNLGWLKDWALEGEIPSFSKNGKSKEPETIDVQANKDYMAERERKLEEGRRIWDEAMKAQELEEANVD